MRAECIAAVSAAAAKMGRDLKPGDIDKIEQRIAQARRDIAVEQGDEYANKTRAEQIKLAAQRVAQDIVAQTRRRAANAARSIQAKINAENFIKQQSAKGEHQVEAINRINVTDQDLGANVSSLEQERRGVYADAMRHIKAMVDSTADFFHFITNKKNVRDVVDEIMGQSTGNKDAKHAADKWLEATESLRQQYNELGGNIRKLAYGYLPQKWSQARLANVDADTFAADIVPRLNRRFYRDETGRPLTDPELTAMVKKIHFDASTDNSFVGGDRGRSAAERHQDRRVLHFKSGQDWMDVQAKYGVGSVLEAMASHVNTMSKEIAAMKVWGPTPDTTFNQVLKDAAKREVEANPKTADDVQAKATVARSMYEAAIGRMGPIGNPKVFRAFQVMRSLNLLRLGSSALSALSDGSNVTMVAKSWSIPYVRRYLYGLKAWLSSDFRNGMNSQGIGVETFAHLFARFGEENMGHGTTANFAQAMLRLFLINHIDNVRRTASGAMLMNTIERLAAKHADMTTMHDQDSFVLRHRGVTPEDFAVWKAAGQDLSPDKIAQVPDAALQHLGNPDQLRRNAAQKLLGVALSDVDTVVPLMTAKTLGKIEEHGWVGKRGTIGGELIRSFLTFKSFPLSNFTNHLDRMQSYGTLGGKALYAAQIIATSTVMGAISVQLKAMANGENPQDMTDPKFAGRALVQGGALGLYFDILMGTITNLHGDRPKDAASVIADQMGPTFGSIKDVLDMAANAKPKDGETMADVGNREGEKAVSAVRRLAPMPFYAKAALDRLVFQQLQDMFAPGYAERANQRVQQQYNSGYYWPPSSAGRVNPPQAPNFNTATGGR